MLLHEEERTICLHVRNPRRAVNQEIRVQEAAFRTACNYDDQNLDLKKTFLENGIDPSLRKSLHRHIEPANGSVSYYNILCNHVLGKENTKLKLYQWIILETKPSDFGGLNITNYHEKILPALCSAHQANSLLITFGGQLLSNHAGPIDPGYVSLVSMYAAKMHTLNTTKSQFQEAIVQLPQLEIVF